MGELPKHNSRDLKPGFFNCESCAGWGFYAMLMTHGYGFTLDSDSPRPMFNACPACLGSGMVEGEQLTLAL